MAAKDAEARSRYALAVVGSTPIAKSVREALIERRFPYSEVRLLGSAEEEVQILEFDGEPRIMGKAEPDALKGVNLAFFCEDPGSAGAYRDWPESGGYLAIDLTAGAGGEIPLADGGLQAALPPPRRGWLAATHPLAHLLLSLLAPIEARIRVRALSGVILRPAADFGQEGLDELYQQSVNLFKFDPLPSRVFERQLAFNLIPGEPFDGGAPLARQIALQISSVLGREDLSISLFLAVAPVFHAHTLALHLEFDGRPTEAALRDLLRASGDLRVGAEPLTALEVADQPLPHVALIRRDLDGSGAWVWMVADRVSAGAASGAVRLAERLMGVEPRPGGRRETQS
jgi:aspartate-semialdehyde dehydrogenase